jgi:hypothetical protein
VAVAAVLAQPVTEAEQVAEGRARKWLGERPREQGAPRGVQVIESSLEQLGPTPGAGGVGSQQALQLAHRPLEASIGDGGGVGERPAVGDGGDHDLHVEHPEGGGHQLAGCLAEG